MPVVKKVSQSARLAFAEEMLLSSQDLQENKGGSSELRKQKELLAANIYVSFLQVYSSSPWCQSS